MYWKPIHLLLCVLTLTLSFSAALAQPREKARKKYDYSLHLPKEYNADKKDYPLMIYLHGGGQRGQDLTKLDAYGPPKLIKEGRNFDFIVASPQCPEDKYWSTDNWFEPLYAELLSRYRVDKKRVYLTRISMGGYGTWQTAMAYPIRLRPFFRCVGAATTQPGSVRSVESRCGRFTGRRISLSLLV